MCKGTQFTTRLMNRGGAVAIGLLILLIGSAGVASSKDWLRAGQRKVSIGNEHPPLYLPSAEYVRLVTLGFNNFSSNIFWFTTINYFGKHYAGDRDYRWLFNMCDLVTELDANKEFVYEFCGTLLSWEAKDATLSNKILDKAIKHFPKSWRYYYLRGFNFWYFLENIEAARHDFEVASKLDGAPHFITTITSRLIASSDNVDTAVSFLQDALQRTKDQTAQKALKKKLKQAMLSQNKNRLTALAKEYEKTKGEKLTSLEQLVSAGYLKAVPGDGFGGTFKLESKTGEIVSSSGKKGLEFQGKSARTGSFKQEFE